MSGPPAGKEIKRSTLVAKVSAHKVPPAEHSGLAAAKPLLAQEKRGRHAVGATEVAPTGHTQRAVAATSAAHRASSEAVYVSCSGVRRDRVPGAAELLARKLQRLAPVRGFWWWRLQRQLRRRKRPEVAEEAVAAEAMEAEFPKSLRQRALTVFAQAAVPRHGWLVALEAGGKLHVTKLC